MDVLSIPTHESYHPPMFNRPDDGVQEMSMQLLYREQAVVALILGPVMYIVFGITHRLSSFLL
jgi:hypothetical protein